MIKHCFDFFVTYFLIPYSVVLYLGFTFFAMRDLVLHWLKERREKKDANKNKGDA